MKSSRVLAVALVLVCGGWCATSAEAAGVNGRLLGATVFTGSGTYSEGLNFLTSPTNAGNFQEIHWSGTGSWVQVVTGSTAFYTANWGTPGMGPHGTYIGLLFTLPTGPSFTVGVGNNSVNGGLVYIGQ